MFQSIYLLTCNQHSVFSLSKYLQPKFAFHLQPTLLFQSLYLLTTNILFFSIFTYLHTNIFFHFLQTYIQHFSFGMSTYFQQMIRFQFLHLLSDYRYIQLYTLTANILFSVRTFFYEHFVFSLYFSIYNRHSAFSFCLLKTSILFRVSVYLQPELRFQFLPTYNQYCVFSLSIPTYIKQSFRFQFLPTYNQHSAFSFCLLTTNILF